MHATEPEAKHGDQKKRVGSTRVADPATILPEGVIGKSGQVFVGKGNGPL